MKQFEMDFLSSWSYGRFENVKKWVFVQKYSGKIYFFIMIVENSHIFNDCKTEKCSPSMEKLLSHNFLSALESNPIVNLFIYLAINIFTFKY